MTTRATLPEHLLDARGRDRACPAEFVPHDPSATCVTSASSDDGWAVHVWRSTEAFHPRRVDAALLIVRPDETVAALQFTVPGGSPLYDEALVDALVRVGPALTSRRPRSEHDEKVQRQAWAAVRTVHAVTLDPDWWWGSTETWERQGRDLWMVLWACEGVTSAADARDWESSVGRYALDWTETGFTAADASRWCHLPHDGKRLTPDTATPWVGAGFTPDTAHPWMDRPWVKRRDDVPVRPQTAKAAVTAGWDRDAVDALLRALRTVGVSAKQANRSAGPWIRSGLTPERACAYVLARFTVADAQAEETAGPPTCEQLQMIAALRS